VDPKTCYRHCLEKYNFTEDADQYKIVEYLHKLFYQLKCQQKWWPFHFLTAPFIKNKTQGAYIYGDVGRGKTHLMNLFFEHLPIKNKKRMHFYQFMQLIHKQLKLLAGTKKPLKIVAKKLYKQAKVLCIDEFFVVDIADAMILARLFDNLFAQGCILVMTSNCHPDELYKEGLHRNRFLPTIRAIKANMKILNLDGKVDFRLSYLQKSNIYLYADEANPIIKMKQYFAELVASHEIYYKTKLKINNRYINSVQNSADVVWVTFDELCNTARSSHDYIEIAKEFHTVFIENIPIFNDENLDQTRRFIQLIDELYDKKVKLIALFAIKLDKLYQGNKLAFEFQRTYSRLQEMQTNNYLAIAHQN
jgi:cell division protein ZapE